jgi:hypothetical protein
VKDTPFAPLELAIENSSGDELDFSAMELDEIEPEIQKEAAA